MRDMADGKWISDLSGAMPAREAARRVFALRLAVVHARLPLAVERPEEDVEHVHQLRVGTRRAGAALRAFASLLPERLARQARRTLRALRRAAGLARDWDVFVAMVAERLPRATARQRRGLDFLCGVGRGQRAPAQEQLRIAAQTHGPRLSGVMDEIDQALADHHHAAGPTLRDLAVPALTEFVRDLERAAAGDLRDYARLHRVRILGKKLRYAMELFESCFAPAFRADYYPAVEEMQEILGLANDSHVAAGRLAELRVLTMAAQPDLWRAYAPGVESLLRFHQRRLPRQRRTFEKWWDAWRSSGAEQAFAELIAQER